jgi:hypothetical protein
MSYSNHTRVPSTPILDDSEQLVSCTVHPKTALRMEPTIVRKRGKELAGIHTAQVREQQEEKRKEAERLSVASAFLADTSSPWCRALPANERGAR